MTPLPPRSTLFPYTTLFRSVQKHHELARGATRARLEPRTVEISGHCASARACRVCQIVDRKSTRLNSSHLGISYAVFCLKKKKTLFGCTIQLWIDGQVSGIA